MAERPTAADPRIVTCDAVAGYPPRIGRYVAQLAEVRGDLKQEVTSLSIAQVDWHPDEQTESIGTLLLHLAGVEWSWIHEDIFGRPDSEYPGSWDEAMPIRQSVPQVQGRPVAAYLEHLDAIRAETLRVLQGFTDADLDRHVGEVPPPGWEPGSLLYSIDWILWHIVEHEATHVGQIELLRRLGPGVADQPGG